MNEFRVHRPGAVSVSFILKAVLFAVAFWAWLVALAIRGDEIGGWSIVAAAGASTTSLVAVALWIRYSAQQSAATRHEQIMENLVDLSWQSFAMSAREHPREPSGSDLPAAAAAVEQARRPVSPDASVIQLAPEGRQRPRR